MLLGLQPPSSPARCAPPSKHLRAFQPKLLACASHTLEARYLFRATTWITLIAPYTGDPTWDYFDALFMSVLAFTTAPWTVGTLYRVVQSQLPARQGFVAFGVGMFSASWSYDL